jgi:hypothetical protein
MKAYERTDVYIHIFLSRHWLEVSGQLHAPASITSGEEALGAHWIGGWVDPRAGLDYMEKRTFLTLPGLELRPHGRLARRQSLDRLRYRVSLLC